MKNRNVVKLLGYGNQGTILTPAGKETTDFVYSMTEYVQSINLSKISKTLFKMGEVYGKYIFDQILRVLE